MSKAYTITRIRPTLKAEDTAVGHGSLLRSWLESNGMTQGQLATQIGVTPGYVNNLVNGKHKNIRIHLLRRIAQVTSLPMTKLVDDLLTGYMPGKDGAA